MRKQFLAWIPAAAIVVALSAAPAATAAVPAAVARSALPAVRVCGEGAAITGRAA